MVPLKLSDISEPIESVVLPNGLSLLIHPFPAPAIGLSVLVRCGPVFETLRNNGVSHFLEHMLFRGIPGYPSSDELGKALDKVGSDSNAATFTDMTIISQRVLPEALEEAMVIFRGMITEPVFSGIGVERKIITEECLEDVDELGQTIAMDQLSSQLLYGDHPYSFSILGTPEIVRKLKASALRDHLKRHYRPSAAVICLSGGISPKRGLSLTKKVFGNWKNPSDGHPVGNAKEVPELKGPRLLAVNSPRSQIQCRISFKGAAFTDPDFHVSEALTRILDSASGSPLRKVIQDDFGFCYSLGTGIDAYEKCGAIHIDLTVQVDRLIDAIRMALEVLAKMGLDGCSRELTEYMNFQYVKSRRFASTDLWDFSGRCAFNLLYPGSGTFENEFEQTQKIKPADLQKTASRLFTRKNLGLTLVGSLSKELVRKIENIIHNFP